MQTVVSGAQFLELIAERVKLRGVYTRLPAPIVDRNSSGTGDWTPSTRPYAQALLHLEADGYAVAINSPLLKTSLRSPDELERFDRQLVELIGVIGFLATDQSGFVQLESDVVQVSG